MIGLRKPEPNSNALTQEHDESLKAQLGLGILQALDNRAVGDSVREKQRIYNDQHLRFQEARLRQAGVSGNLMLPQSEDSMGGATVRIDSDDKHYHGPSLLTTATLAAALAAGLTGIGLSIMALREPSKADQSSSDTDTRSTLRPYDE